MRLQFDVEWRITLATLVLLPILTGLGFWQLQRAEEKSQLEQEWEQRQAAAPVPLEALRGLPGEQLVYRGVQLDGEFLADRYLLLDNRTRQGRFGYEVVGILALAEGGLALVNRGWIPGDASRQTLPDVVWPSGRVQVRGYLYRPPGDPFLLGEQDFGGSWPLRLQALDMTAVATRLAAEELGEMFPMEVRLQAGQPGALVTDWQLINASPAKHQGYAVQWFSMAAFLLFFWLLRNTNLWSLIRERRAS